MDESRVRCAQPPSLSLAQAAAVPLAALTSFQSMRAAGLALPQSESEASALSKRVLILGGTGGTGHLGVQFARAMGASFIAATGSDEAFLRELGVDLVINYKQTDWVAQCQNAQLDVVYDTVGGYESWAACKEHGILKSSGHYATIAGDVQVHDKRALFRAPLVLDVTHSIFLILSSFLIRARSASGAF